MTLVWLAPTNGLAGGGYVPRAGGPVANTRTERAALILEGNSTTLILQVGLTAGPRDFAWIIPTTGLVAARQVRQTEADVFDRLHAWTAPTLLAWTQSREDYGCAEHNQVASTPVIAPAFEGYRAASLDLQILNTDQSRAVGDWLSGNGYAVDAAAQTLLDGYVEQGAFFVVARISGATPAGPNSTAVDLSRPIAIQLAGDEPIFPLGLSRLGGGESLDVLLYVLAAQRYEVANAANVELSLPGRVAAGLTFDEWYQDQWLTALENQVAPAFGVEFADNVSEELVAYLLGREPVLATSGAVPWFVTRLHGLVPLASVSGDLLLRPRGETGKGDRVRLRVMAGSGWQSMNRLAPLGAAGLGLGLVLIKRRFQRTEPRK